MGQPNINTKYSINKKIDNKADNKVNKILYLE